jgi:polyphosphate kinase 2 (PPK2 family)
MPLSELAKRYRVRKGRDFRLADFDPADTGGLSIDKEEAKSLIAGGIEQLASLQDRLYSEHNWAVLIILQGMDTSGRIASSNTSCRG